MENQTPTDEIVTKPKKMNLSDEERQRRSERMKALAKTRNDLLKRQKAERITAEAIPEPAPAPAPAPTPVEAPTPVRAPRKKAEKPVEKPAKKSTAKKVKKVVVVQSSDSDTDYGDSATSGEDDDEVVYVAKRSSKSDKMTKPKKTKVMPAPVESVPEIKIKFF